MMNIGAGHTPHVGAQFDRCGARGGQRNGCPWLGTHQEASGATVDPRKPRPGGSAMSDRLIPDGGPTEEIEDDATDQDLAGLTSEGDDE